MSIVRSLFGVALLAVLSGCRSSDVSESAQAATQKPPGAAPRAAAIAPSESPRPATPAASAPPSNAVEWKGDIQWHTWSDGLALASHESKPMLVLVYADWCPHCRALGPVFSDPEIEALARKFVMVRQNNDDDPAWLAPYNQKYGGYVPRIFFFDSNGKMREDLTSGHPQYPYFYAAEQPEFLKNTMRRAIGS